MTTEDIVISTILMIIIAWQFWSFVEHGLELDFNFTQGWVVIGVSLMFLYLIWR